eukprot:166190_1
MPRQPRRSKRKLNHVHEDEWNIICCDNPHYDQNETITCDVESCTNYTHFQCTGFDAIIINNLRKGRIQDIEFVCIECRPMRPRKLSLRKPTIIYNDSDDDEMDEDDDLPYNLRKRKHVSYAQNDSEEITDEDKAKEEDEQKAMEFEESDDTQCTKQSNKKSNKKSKKIKKRKDETYDKHRTNAMSKFGIETGVIGTKKITEVVEQLTVKPFFEEWVHNELKKDGMNTLKSPLSKPKKKKKGQGQGGGIRTHWSDTQRMIYVKSMIWAYDHCVQLNIPKDEGISATLIHRTNQLAKKISELLEIDLPLRSDYKLKQFFNGLNNYSNKAAPFVIEYQMAEAKIRKEENNAINSSSDALVTVLCTKLKKQNEKLKDQLQKRSNLKTTNNDIMSKYDDILATVKQKIKKQCAEVDDDLIVMNQCKKINNVIDSGPEEKAYTATKTDATIEKEFLLDLFEYQRKSKGVQARNEAKTVIVQFQTAMIDATKKNTILTQYRSYRTLSGVSTNEIIDMLKLTLAAFR